MLCYALKCKITRLTPLSKNLQYIKGVKCMLQTWDERTGMGLHTTFFSPTDSLFSLHHQSMTIYSSLKSWLLDINTYKNIFLRLHIFLVSHTLFNFSLHSFKFLTLTHGSFLLDQHLQPFRLCLPTCI